MTMNMNAQDTLQSHQETTKQVDGSLSTLIKAFTILFLLIAVIIFIVSRIPSDKQNALKRANSISDPWLKYSALMENQDTNDLILKGKSAYSEDTEDDIEFANTARKALEGALAGKSAAAFQYACFEQINNGNLAFVTRKYCPTISLDDADKLLDTAKVDARNQGFTEPDDKTKGDLARKHGARYTPKYWEFPSVKERRAFERELAPSQNFSHD